MPVKINTLIAIIATVSILAVPLFFSIMGLFGLEYEGSESSSAYVIYVVLIATFSMLTYLYVSIKKGFLKQELILIAIIIVLFVLHIFWVIFDPVQTVLIPDFLIFFLLLGLPGFFSAATITKLNLMVHVIRIMEVMLLIIASGVIAFSVIPTLAGVRTASLAGASYQALSYYSAFIFGMLLAYNTQIPTSFRFTWTKSKWYSGFIYVVMISCVIGTLLGGGRGAFLLLIAYFLIYLVSLFSIHKITLNSLLRGFIRLILIIISISLFVDFFGKKDFIQFGFTRATQFISSDGGIDLAEGSSGRDVVYQVAIEYIDKNPISGYGPFGFREKTIHAHNIFLEILLQFGLIGVIIFITLIIILIIKAVKNRSVFSFWVFCLLLYPMVNLMFSGAYLHDPIFIFGISLLVLLKKQKIQHYHSISNY
jgi:O-antigen ligase